MTSKGFSHQDVPSSQAESSNSWNSGSRNLLSVMTSSLVTSNLNPKPSASGKVTSKAKSYVLNPCKDSNNLSLHNDPFQCPWRHQCHSEQQQAQQSLGEGGTCLSLPAWEHHGWALRFQLLWPDHQAAGWTSRSPATSTWRPSTTRRQMVTSGSSVWPMPEVCQLAPSHHYRQLPLLPMRPAKSCISVAALWNSIGCVITV